MNNNQYILDYLNYLKELSKKIGVRVDFSSLIRSKSRKKFYELRDSLFYYEKDLNLGDMLFINMKHDHDLYSYLIEQLYSIENSNKSIFLGVGLLKYTVKENEKYVNKAFGPLIIVNLEIEEDDNEIYLYIGTPFINYDLLNALSESLGNDEDIETIIELKRIVEFTRDLEEKIEKAEKLSDLRSLAADAVIEIPEVFNLTFEPDYNYDNKFEIIADKGIEDIINEKVSIYLDRVYFFVGSIPPELSTFKSLELLIQEVQNGEFKNEALRKLFISVFKDKINLVSKKDNFALGDYEFLIPMQLSESQKKAIENVINYEISYIQGPPGTGKSHTITALALLSILLNKKILIVSQKPPAIKVLFEKLTEILGLGKNGLIPFIYYYEEYKKRMKENLKMVEDLKLQDGSKEKLKILRDKAKNHIEELKKLIEDYKHYLQLENQYYNIREYFGKELEYFEKDFFEIKSSIDSLRNINLEHLKGEKKTFEALEKRGTTRLMLIRKKRLYSFLKKHYKEIKDFKSFLKIKQSFFLDLLTKALDNYKKLQNVKSKIEVYSDIQKLTNRINFVRNELFSISKQIIALDLILRIYEKSGRFRDDLVNLRGIFHWQKDSKLKEAQNRINYNNILDIFNIWIVDISNVDRILPMKPNLFDIVVVDEASQVNLAQIIPVFYRGKHICVVGDHKQLSLESTGLQFAISNRLDRYIWEKYRPGKLDYEKAKNKNLTLTKSSILDLLISDYSDKNPNTENYSFIPAKAQTMLNEHFRSVYPLAVFNSKRFYENKLHIMTKNPNLDGKAFFSVKVSGKRHKKYNVVEEEIEETCKIIEGLRRSRRYSGIVLPVYVPDNFSIGVLAFTRDQAEQLKVKINAEYGFDDVFIGTTEEFQGHEKDIMIISPALDETLTRSKNFYENKNRFNVATSRAKYFTFFVYAGIPENFHLTKEYIAHFEKVENLKREDIRMDGVCLDESKFESELERFVYNYLSEIITNINRDYNADIRIFNQYETCGYRLDFLLYNRKNKKFIALEVDGPYHYEKSETQINYADWHIERAERLKRAGWQIIHTPYYKWYINGWLDKGSKIMREEIERIEKEVIENLI